MDLGKISYARARAESLGDCVLLSSLRTRVEGLQKIALRWSELEPLIQSADFTGVKIAPGSQIWKEFETGLDAVKKAVPGYKGRVTAVRSMVAKANGFYPETVSILDDSALNLGVMPEKKRVWNDEGKEKVMDNLWWRREWNVSEKLGSPEETAQIQIRFHVRPTLPRMIGQETRMWPVTAFSCGKINWDMDVENPAVQQWGNGGYPRIWEEALWTGTLRPHRSPYFWAFLTTGKDDESK